MIVNNEDRPPYAVHELHVPTAPSLYQPPPHWWVVGLDGEGGLRSIEMSKYTDEVHPPEPPFLAEIAERARAKQWAWPGWAALTFARTEDEARRAYLAWLSREKCR